MTPRLTIVLLTLNEAANIQRCLDSLRTQTVQDFVVIVIDAASDDGTVDIVRREGGDLPMPLTLEASSRRLPIGEARNLGVRMAQTPYVAFLSADAELDPRWVGQALTHLEDAGMVFGRQVHMPHRWTTGAAVRGLRYHFPRKATAHPLRYASNVAAAYRRDILQRHPFDPWANAAEDLLLAERGAADGHHAVYDPHMLVLHHDVDTFRAEWQKSVREGHGWGLYAQELGPQRGYLAWGTLLAGAGVATAVAPAWGLPTLALALWGPALRRAARNRREMPPRALAKGVLATPLFDLAFLINHLRGLVGRRGTRTTMTAPLETRE